MTLKIASVIGRVFSLDILREIYPDEKDRPQLAQHVAALIERKLLARASGDGARVHTFVDAATQDGAYQQMLFAQRRQLHRAIAEWHERVHASDLAPFYSTLSRHWRAANEPSRAVPYLEQAAARARECGALEDAQRYLHESLGLAATASGLSREFRR